MRAFVRILVSYLMVLVRIAFFTLIERKYLGYMQLRKGPNKVGFVGVPQPLGDAVKLFLKEHVMPSSSNKVIFIVMPRMGLIFALMMWGLYPVYRQVMFISLGVLFFLCVSRLMVYVVIGAG